MRIFLLDYIGADVENRFLLRHLLPFVLLLEILLEFLVVEELAFFLPREFLLVFLSDLDDFGVVGHDYLESAAEVVLVVLPELIFDDSALSVLVDDVFCIVIGCVMAGFELSGLVGWI